MSLGDGAGGVPAGWYPDPADESRLRRWDGANWTADVILAPEQAPAFPSAPASPASSPMAGFAAPNVNRPPAPPQYAEPPAPSGSFSAPPPSDFSQRPQSAPAPGAQSAPPPPPPSGPPGPASPLASSPPPDPYAPAGGQPQSPTPNFSSPPPGPPPGAQAGPQGPQSAQSPPSPPAPDPDLPEWATLPGLTLPPDLSGIPGLEQDPVLKAPKFEDVKRLEIKPEWDGTAQPSAPQAPAPYTHPTPAKDYAPPPAGAQYDVPPPPGATPAPAAGPVLPPSALPDTRIPVGRRSTSQLELPPAPTTAAPPRVPPTAPQREARAGGLTIWAWLIALLPLIQFGVLFLVFAQLGSEFQPGMQWGILAAPAAFSLLFAIGDQRSLVRSGVERAPSPLLALVPPIYLLARAIDAGRSSALLLVAWLVFQAAAVGGVYYLLPTLLAEAIKSVG